MDKDPAVTHSNTPQSVLQRSETEDLFNLMFLNKQRPPFSTNFHNRNNGALKTQSSLPHERFRKRITTRDRIVCKHKVKSQTFEDPRLHCHNQIRALADSEDLVRTENTAELPQYRNKTFKDNLQQHLQSARLVNHPESNTSKSANDSSIKDFPYLGAPTGRREVINLLDWIEYMKEHYISPVLDGTALSELSGPEEDKALDSIGSILDTGMCELTRQISIGCLDRGVALNQLHSLNSQFLRFSGQLRRRILREKFVALSTNFDLYKAEQDSIQQDLRAQIAALSATMAEKEHSLAAQSELTAQLQDQVQNLELEKKFLLTTEVKLYDEFNVEKGTSNLKQLLFSDSVAGFKVRKIYKLFSAEATQRPKNVLKPVYSKKLDRLDPFFQSKGSQATFAVKKSAKSCAAFPVQRTQEVQTEEQHIEEDVSFTSYTSSVKGSAVQDESYEVPNVIIVTTEANEQKVEYAFVPHEGLVVNTDLAHIMKEEPLLLRTPTGIPDASPILPLIEEPSQLEITVSECSELFESSSDSASDREHLIVPKFENTSIEIPKQHHLNPDPFTDRDPKLDLSFRYSRRAGGARRLPKKVIKKKHRAAQTDTDLLLENEESEIFDQMIDYKKNLLRKVDQELVITKSRLLALTKNYCLTENSLREVARSPADSLSSLFTVLKANGNLPADTHCASWNCGFLQGLAHTQICAPGPPSPTKASSRPPSSPAVAPVPSEELLRSFFQKHSVPSKLNSVTRKMLFKKINLIYSSAVSRETYGETLPCLLHYSYNYIQSRHQDSTVADKKFLELISACLKHSDVQRVAIFIKLLGVAHYVDLEDYIRPAQSFAFCISLLSRINRSRAGVVLAHHDDNDAALIPKVRAIECVKEHFAVMYSPGRVSQLTRTIERLSGPDPLKVNTNGVVSQDLVLDFIMDSYQTHCKDTLCAATLLVEGLDLEGRGQIHTSELTMSVRHLSPAALAHLPVTSESSIHSQDVYELCIQRGLLSTEQIQQFLGSTTVPDPDQIQSTLFSSLETLNSIAAFKDKLGISSEIEELWKSKLSLFAVRAAQVPRAVHLAFSVFLAELRRLKSLI